MTHCRIVKHLDVPKRQIPFLGKPALVTGSSSGLGRELAVLFSQSGHVILSGRDKDELERTRQLCKDPANTTTICGDLRNSETLELFASFADLYKIHYLVCCAGEYLSGPFGNSTAEQAASIISSNLTATISLVRTLYPKLVGNLDGLILHINSLAGKTFNPDELAYTASKWGARAFFSGLRLDARKYNIRVLEAYPSAMQTPLCEGRDNYARLMGVCQAAKTIYDIATSEPFSLQIEEIHLGRFPA